jgi:uncharacterized protein YbjT (DUF2867 family)
MVSSASPRSALLAGASGLVGRALLGQLLADQRYGQVEVVARRPLPAELSRQPRLAVRIGDVATLAGREPAVDDVYIALGTTIKIAGSEAAFRDVDFELVVAVARAARAAGANRLALVSALGADPAARVFYSRVKGEAEAAVSALGFASVVIARPSLLSGDRSALGQPTRSGEVWATRLSAPFRRFVPAAVRPIDAAAVAAALIAAMAAAQPGVRVLSSAAMQEFAPR